MSHSGCGSSGLITADTLVHTGRCKLVSIHGYNAHVADNSIIIVYDNTAASGKIVAKIILPAVTYGVGGPAEMSQAISTEFDMHGVICYNGLYVDVTAGTPNLTVEYA
jgi:hydroxymethylglutaryl-CoA reductase